MIKGLLLLLLIRVSHEENCNEIVVPKSVTDFYKNNFELFLVRLRPYRSLVEIA